MSLDARTKGSEVEMTRRVLERDGSRSDKLAECFTLRPTLDRLSWTGRATCGWEHVNVVGGTVEPSV